MSIKVRLSIYNAILMSIMVVIVIGFLMVVSNSVVTSSSQEQLVTVVEEYGDEVEYDDGKLDLDDVDIYNYQVSILIYSGSGVLLEGTDRYGIEAGLKDGQLETIDIDGTEYIYYDVFVKDENLYIRGITSNSVVTGVLDETFHIAIIMLPVFILLSAIGSYLLCKRSFKPLDTVIETAEKISEDDDLTLRINAKQGKDEISRLATTFDKMMEKLENMMKTEKQFTSDVSHELRTPVSVILAECEISKDGTQEELKQSVQGIEIQATKIRNLINQLLNLVRLENGIHKPELEPVDLSELVEIICNEQRLVVSSTITIVDEIQPNIIHNLDYAMMSRVLVNLINNSVKYIGNGNKIKIKLHEVNNQIHILVSDNGMGIPSSELDKIFTRFYQVDKSRTETTSMGLGLSMVKQFVELNGGTIEVTSELEMGSTFKITFNK